MGLRACLGMLLVSLGACAHIPEVVRIEVDGSTVEFNKKTPVAPADAPHP